MTTRPKLTLIDGSSYLFRAYHALPTTLTNATGEPTNALFGVVSMLRNTLKDPPDYIAFVLDASGSNFRHEIYADYKANRPPTPTDLKAQITPLIEIVKAIGIPFLQVTDVEADDVIGSLACKAVQDGFDVYISTSDKDFNQLVGPHVTLINTMTNTRTTPETVYEKYGVTPDQFIDYLALVGDSVDNIPGVEKCGPKTASKWLREYKTITNLLTHADQIKGKVGENLRHACDWLATAQQLTRILTALELPLQPHELKLQQPDTVKLQKLFQHYGFKSLISTSQTSATTPDNIQPSTSASATYNTILSEADLQALITQLEQAEYFSFDTETTGLDAQQAEIVGCSFSHTPGHAVYIPLSHCYPEVPQQLSRDATLLLLKPLLENPTKVKIGQHGKYDMHILANYGIYMQGYKHDTMLASYVLNATATRHDMDSLAKFYLGTRTISYESVTGKGAKQIPFAEVDIDKATTYAAEDADITLQLYEKLWPQLQQTPSLQSVYETIEIPLVPVLAKIERHGVLIDTQLLKTQTHTLRTYMHELTLEAHSLAGHHFNLDSPKQLQQVLFQQFQLPIKHRTPTGQPSTNEEALAELADEHPLPKCILQYRTYAKLVSTYTDKLPQQINPKTGRIHTSFHQAVAATGRLSSSDPNLQNIPIRTEEGRRIRQAFIAPPEHRILAADYSQIELRIMAHLSKDSGLLRAFQASEDVHRSTAAEVFGTTTPEVTSEQRRAAKAINFGLMYGMGPHGLARQLSIPRQEAQAYIDRYFARYPNVHQFMDEIRAQVRQTGFVETLFGRRLYLPGIHAQKQVQRNAAERAAINAPMQGTAADIIKLAMLSIDNWLTTNQFPAQMIMQVHDELVFEVRTDHAQQLAEQLHILMPSAVTLAVPLEVDIGIGANWQEAH